MTIKTLKTKIKKLDRKSEEQLADGNYDAFEQTCQKLQELRLELEIRENAETI